MFKIKEVRKALKKVLKQKKDNLIRLRFDLYYSDKIARKMEQKEIDYTKKRYAKINNLKAEKEAKENDIQKERAKGSNKKDYNKIKTLKQRVVEIDNQIGTIEREIDSFQKRKEEAKKDRDNRLQYTVQGQNLVDELENCLNSKKALKFLSERTKYEEKD